MVSIDCDEVFPENLSVENIAGYLSELKADAYRNLEKNEILLTSDTIVTFEGKVLGKPKNREEAVEMLQHLSGKLTKFTPLFHLKLLKKSSLKLMLQM